MEIYIIKSGGIMLFILAVYYLLLRQETFYRNNRFYLLAGLILSIVLPFITFTKIHWVEAAKIQPIDQRGIVGILPAGTFSESSAIDWTQIFLGIYCVGAVFFAVKFIMDLIDLKKVLRGQPIVKYRNYKMVETSGNVSPFSYFNYIVYNPELYSKVELANIIEHEKVHCNQVHSFDVIVSRIYCILFWFNPFAWLYKKTIIQNLEFIADNEASGKISDRLSYQITLVKVTAHENCVAITNHFFQSLIKKRIVMLNKNQSKRTNQWKYAIVLPALLIFIMQFQINVIAQEKPKNAYNAAASFSDDAAAEIDAFMVLPTTTDAELKSYEKQLKKQNGMEMKFTDIVRNGKNELRGFNFWYDDKTGKPQTLKVLVKNPEDLFFMVQVEKDGSHGRINVTTYNKNEPQSYSLEADTITWKNNDIVKEPVGDLTRNHKNMLIIIGEKQYMANDIVDGNFILEVDGTITTLLPEEGMKKYGERAKEGVMIINGKAEIRPKHKAPTEFPKTVTLENGDEVVFMKDGQMKLPGFPTLNLEKAGTALIINDVIYDHPKAVIENMDLDRIKTIRIVESENSYKQKELKVVMKID